MSLTISELANCPRGIQGDSKPYNKCLDIWKDVARLIIKDVDGVDPINGTPLADAAALKAAIETKATWDAAKALTTTDKVTFTTKIQDAQKPKVINEPVVLANEDRVTSGTFVKDVGTYMMYGADGACHADLMRMIGTGRQVMFIDAGGDIIYKNLSDAEVAAGASPWFDTDYFNVSTRDILTGSGNIDSFDVVISYPFTELVDYAKADTGAFGLTISLTA